MKILKEMLLHEGSKEFTHLGMVVLLVARLSLVV